MISYHRIFPRYEIKNLSHYIRDHLNTRGNFSIINFSLGGLKIESDQLLKTSDQVVFDINLLKRETFILTSRIIWSDENGEKLPFRYGLEIKFSKEDNYLRWKKLALAFHLLKNKKTCKT